MPDRPTAWRKLFRRKAKQLSKRVRKAIMHPFLCMCSCTDDTLEDLVEPQTCPAPPVSVGVQTGTPFIIDMLRHEGEAMRHRPSLGFNISKSKLGQSQSDKIIPIREESLSHKSRYRERQGKHTSCTVVC